MCSMPDKQFLQTLRDRVNLSHDFWWNLASCFPGNIFNAFLEHVILEQVCIAALDTYQIAIVDYCIKQLSIEFPSSVRVKKYYVMRLEAQERYDDALRILDNIIKKDGSNSAPRKRKIAILKAQGRYVEAVKELTEYLKE